MTGETDTDTEIPGKLHLYSDLSISMCVCCVFYKHVLVRLIVCDTMIMSLSS